MKCVEWVRNLSGCRDVAMNKMVAILRVHSRGTEARYTLNEYIISTMNVTKEKVLDILAQVSQSKLVHR